ncbi:MAG: WHG domain-containing protein [Desulfobacteraceae bacterium]|nr:WHG domain-containing protein [Desulfobacteraceae bacterium]
MFTSQKLKPDPSPFSFFTSMDVLEEELVKMTVDLLYTHMARERTGDPWIDHGIGYVLFAREETHLFRGCNNEKNISRFKEHGDIIWQKCTDSLMAYPPFQGMTDEQIYQVQFTRWLMAHGLAFQVSNPPPVTMDRNFIVATVQQGSFAILNGLKAQFKADAVF